MSFYSDFAEYYEAVFPFREEVYAFLRSCLPEGSRRVLDVGCGTGHYCGRLAADGLEAVGIDLDPKMVAAARARYPAPSFHCLNMRDVGTLPGPLDAIFCIGNVAAHLPRDAFAAFLEGIAGLLHPSGPWIVQVVNWDYLLQHESYGFPPRTVADSGVVFLREYQGISEAEVCFATRLAAGEATIFEGQVTLYPLRTADCLELHRLAGFESVGHYADFRRAPFDPGSDSGSVFVFRKRG